MVIFARRSQPILAAGVVTGGGVGTAPMAQAPSWAGETGPMNLPCYSRSPGRSERGRPSRRSKDASPGRRVG